MFTLARMALTIFVMLLGYAALTQATKLQFSSSSQGQHPQLVNEANTGSLTLLPVFCSYKTYSNQLLEYCFAVLPG